MAPFEHTTEIRKLAGSFGRLVQPVPSTSVTIGASFVISSTDID